MIVTGSEGFIGKALCRELTKRGVEVIGLDRKSGTEATKVCELLKNGGIDCVFHLAAQTSVFNGNLEQIRKDNIDTFMRVADACNQYHVKLVYASSSTANPENTTSMYGISKYFDEQYASIYCKAAKPVGAMTVREMKMIPDKVGVVCLALLGLRIGVEVCDGHGIGVKSPQRN